MEGRYISRIATVSTIVVVLLGASVQAQELMVPRSITPQELGELEQRAIQIQPELLRFQTIEIDTQLLEQQAEQPTDATLTLQAFPDVQFELDSIITKSVKEGQFDLFARLRDEPENRVVLSVKDGRAYGVIRRGNRIYEFRSTPEDGQIVIEVDADELAAREAPNDATPPDDNEPSPPDQPGEFDPGDPDDGENEGDDHGAIEGDGTLSRGPIINVLIGYTNDAERVAPDIEVVAQNAIAVTNQSYEDSGVTQRLHLTRIVDLNYEENGAGARTLRDRLRNPSDGHMDNIHSIRNAAYADIVAVLGTPADFCGFAFIMTSVDRSFNSSAFSVTAQRCAVTNFSFAHELGHNMSARHNWENDNTDNSPFGYNHGFIDPGVSRRTIMSLSRNGCAGCTRIGRWSDPAATLIGRVLGVAFSNSRPTDNHMALNETSGTVARFRQLGMNEADDRFGSVVASGDFDGDGLADLAVGAPGESPGNDPKSGWVFLYRGTEYGLAPWGGFGQAGFGSNEADDRFGSALAVGDFNGDGRDDLAVGAPGEAPGSDPKSGWVFVFRGSASGMNPWKAFGQVWQQ